MQQAPEYPYRQDGWEKQIYPMPSFPLLAVSDMERSSRWYQDVLGFADVFTMRGRDGAPLLAHLRWCTYADILLTPTRAPSIGARVGVSRISAYVHQRRCASSGAPSRPRIVNTSAKPSTS